MALDMMVVVRIHVQHSESVVGYHFVHGLCRTRSLADHDIYGVDLGDKCSSYPSCESLGKKGITRIFSEPIP